jgi:hypothetical protein
MNKSIYYGSKRIFFKWYYFFKEKINICRSLLATAHAPTRLRLLNSSKIFWHFHLKSLHDHKKTAKRVHFGNIWSVFHLTTHEQRKTDQNYKKKHTKHCITRHFFPGMTSVLQKISPDQSRTFLICWHQI